jgi:hypothetical protein
MADDDMFGDSELFAEFDKEREPSGSFILYEKDEHGSYDQSKFIFQVSESSSSEDSDEDEQKLKVQEQSVAYAVGKLQANLEKHKPHTAELNGTTKEINGLRDDRDSDSQEEAESSSKRSIISEDRQAKMSTYKLNYERIL